MIGHTYTCDGCRAVEDGGSLEHAELPEGWAYVSVSNHKDSQRFEVCPTCARDVLRILKPWVSRPVETADPDMPF